VFNIVNQTSELENSCWSGYHSNHASFPQFTLHYEQKSNLLKKQCFCWNSV